MKETIKLKNVGINEEIHTKIKTYCAANKLVLNKLVEEIIKQYMDDKKVKI